jgi:t-SNARE complex subunit (syntaxin)
MGELTCEMAPQGDMTNNIRSANDDINRVLLLSAQACQSQFRFQLILIIIMIIIITIIINNILMPV